MIIKNNNECPNCKKEREAQNTKIEECQCKNKANHSKNNLEKSKNNCCHNKENIEKYCCHSEDNHTEKHCCHHTEQNSEKHCCCHKNKAEEDFGSCCKIEKVELPDCCKKEAIKKEIQRKIIFLSISFVALILSFINFWDLVGLSQISFLDFGYIAVALCGYTIYYNAFKALRKKKITSQLLVSVAITSSIILEIICRATGTMGSHGHSYVFVAGEVSFLMTLGGLIETWTIKSSRKGIERIVNMSPKTANLKVGNDIKLVKISEIKISDIVVVKPNELIPVDGEVVSGNSAVDESSVTGEFIPVDKTIGSVVYGATWNKMGVIEIKVTKDTKDMTVNKLIHLALEAEEQKAPISKLVDRFAGLLVPSIILVAIAIGFISYFVFDLTWMQALIRTVTILVVFCPCSLTLATPTAIAAGIGSGAYNGIIIKSGDALERIAKVNTIAFDKTGTITLGDIKVKEVITFDYDLNEFLTLTCSAEKYSEHPIGKAIVEYGLDKIKLIEPKDTCSQVGVGISVKINKDNISVISLKQAEKEFKNNEDLKKLDKYLDFGYTIVVTKKNDKLIGAMCLYDTIREDSYETMQKIKEMNIDTLMLTGDNINSAKNIAKECGISDVKASLMPEDKLTEINNLQKDGKNVCMIGDGVNDAPALAAADSSIAMSAIGNDVAVETSDIAIMNSDIKNIYNTVKLAKKTLTTIKRNIAISMTINVISLTLSFFGLLNPATGAIVHTCSSIFVVLNSALILKTKYFKSSEKKTSK